MPSEDDENEDRTYKFEELSPRAKKRAIEKFQEWAHNDIDTKQLTDTFKERLEEVGLPSHNISWSLGYTQGDGVSFGGSFEIREYLEKNNLVRDYASLYSPSIEQDESATPVGPKQRKQAEIIQKAISDLGYEASVRQTDSCFFVDVFEDAKEMEWIATFCVGARGRHNDIFVESEKGYGTAAYIFGRARLDARLTSASERAPEISIPIEDIALSIDVSNRYYGPGSMSVEVNDVRGLSSDQGRDLDRLLKHVKNHVDEMAKQLARLGYDDIEWQTSEENITEMLEESDHEFDEEGNLA
ncbi:MAG TPA: hypothetical protein VFA98_12745 [Thermoanaerobaculia bacterium]|jgi:hypothetical protein|nr:hypothetical protein [Thermoanaerobaculia bacterium]